MSDIRWIPAILAAISWGFALNLIMFSSVAIKEGWRVPSIAHMSSPKILGRIGLAVALALCAWAAGWWSLLIAPVVGFSVGAFSTSILKESAFFLSFFLGVIFAIASACVIAFTSW